MPKLESDNVILVSGICGVVSPLLSLALIFLAISFSPWFSWFGNALSDLGVRDLAAVVFNSGLISSGVLTIVFTLGVKYLLRGGILSMIGRILLILTGVMLSGIGLFPETSGVTHFFFSVAFFILLPLSTWTLGADMLRYSREEPWGWFSLIIGAVAIIPWFFPWRGVAIPEMTSALAMSIWSIAMGLRLLRKSSLI
ncbi:MAG TPA: DUF998 domain-containing protein [Candidatus Bathyarchaeia archaeon]|nr:DUF998 domain-containing protein [Candidatus Bathyarchaeia archaeon]